MALIAPSTMSYTTAAVPSLTAAAASDTFAAPGVTGQMFAVYRNTNASTRTITVSLSGLSDDFGRALVDIAYTLGATTGELWIPLHPRWQNSTGVITITTSAQTNVTVGCVRIA
ncbi:hypothetical protein [Streptomyces sp. NPDC048611]|uniref:hypothetical protein n=1 Tax=Streptomyces sp. NPDC048611 TaxID=3155635 RepID=UPI0034161609